MQLFSVKFRDTVVTRDFEFASLSKELTGIGLYHLGIRSNQQQLQLFTTAKLNSKLSKAKALTRFATVTLQCLCTLYSSVSTCSQWSFASGLEVAT
jgi:hypothetical protein